MDFFCGVLRKKRFIKEPKKKTMKRSMFENIGCSDNNNTSNSDDDVDDNVVSQYGTHQPDVTAAPISIMKPNLTYTDITATSANFPRQWSKNHIRPLAAEMPSFVTPTTTMSHQPWRQQQQQQPMSMIDEYDNNNINTSSSSNEKRDDNGCVLPKHRRINSIIESTAPERSLKNEHSAPKRETHKKRTQQTTAEMFAWYDRQKWENPTTTLLRSQSPSPPTLPPRQRSPPPPPPPSSLIPPTTPMKKKMNNNNYSLSLRQTMPDETYYATFDPRRKRITFSQMVENQKNNQ